MSPPSDHAQPSLFQPLEEWAQALEASGDYRVLRRLPIKDVFAEAKPNTAMTHVLIVDTETTGTSFQEDAIVEFTGLKVEVEQDTGQVLKVVDIYSSLDDPKRAIPASSTAIHGITDEMVKGQCIDDDKITALCEGVELVVAHNAAFDRPFLERRLPIFKTLNFGCSHQQIAWAEEGFSGSKLEYLVAQCGFFYEAHRSEIDCRALLAVLATPLKESHTLPLKILLDAHNVGRTRVYATRAPFESKDVLKARGYRWDVQHKVWHTLINSSAFKEEALWLKQEVYHGKASEIQIELLDAKVLFSHRPGVRRTQVI
jgi:DNA polymerase-3 subunit epsilon